MITVIIPTYNEQQNIVGAISSIEFTCKILVIDSYSNDRTVELAKGRGAEIIQRKFDDFSSQKNYAISKVNTEWVFVLDADERIGKALSEEIEKVIGAPGDCQGFFVYRNFYYQREKIGYGGWQTDKVLRLFRRGKGKYDGKLVHEKLQVEGQVGFLKNKIEHYSFQNREHYLSKLSHYANLQARELIQKNKNVTWYEHLFKPGFRFFVLYYIRFGFLDGKKGLDLANLQAQGVKLRHKEYLKAKR